MLGKILKNTGWGFLGEFAARAAKLVQIALIARLLGAEELGRFNHAVAMVGLFSVLIDFGIMPIAIKTLASDPESPALRLYGRLKLICSGIGVGILALVALFSKGLTADAWLIMGMGLYLGLNDLGSFVSVAYRSKGEFWRETVFRTSTSVLQLGICVGAILVDPRIEAVVVVLVFAAALGLIPLAIEWSRQPPVVGSYAGWQGIGTAFGQCLPLAGTILTGSIYMNFDVIVLANHVSMEEVGQYSVAVKTIFGMMIMPLGFFHFATLPVYASRIAGGEEEAMRSEWLQGFLLSSCFGAVISLATALLAGPLLWCLFGREFAPAVPVLVVFTLIGFMFYLYTPISQWLLLRGRQQITFYIQIPAALINIILLYPCVIRWGLWGAVLAAFVTHLLIVMANVIVVFADEEFRNARVRLRPLLRLAVAITGAIALLSFEAGGQHLSKVWAVLAFAVVAHGECLDLIRHLRSLLKKGEPLGVH